MDLTNVGSINGGAAGPYLPLSAGSGFPLTGPLYITSDGGAANGAEIYLKHANNNTTDTIGTLFFGNNADATLSSIVVETNGANNTSNLKLNTSNAGTMSTALTLQGDNDAIFTGNVGIGTTSPGSYDTALVGSDHKFLNVQAGSTNYAVQTLAGDSGTNGNRLGYLTFVNDNNNATYKYSAWIGSEVEGTTANKQGGRLILSTTSDNSTAGPIERMRIDSAGAIKFNAYDSTNNTGTPTYLLGTDASGNVVKSNGAPGGTGYAPATTFSRAGINSSTYTMLATVNWQWISFCNTNVSKWHKWVRCYKYSF